MNFFYQMYEREEREERQKMIKKNLKLFNDSQNTLLAPIYHLHNIYYYRKL